MDNDESVTTFEVALSEGNLHHSMMRHGASAICTEDVYFDTHVAVCSAMPAEEMDCSLPSCTSRACAAGSATSSSVDMAAITAARHEQAVILTMAWASSRQSTFNVMGAESEEP